MFLLKYLSLLSGKIVTIVLPGFAFFASNKLAYNAAPEELPTQSPSFVASSFTKRNASESSTV